MPPVKEDFGLPILDFGLAADQASRNSCDGAHDEPATIQNPKSKIQNRYWRSLEELADTPEFRQFVFNEFPAGATEMLNSSERRDFLKLMGASMALAGLGIAGCRRWPEEKIAPYAHRPPGHNPGTTNQFATCMEMGGIASGLLVTSFDYRPIKIEGNPLHPINGNATQLSANLSEPERIRDLHGSTDGFAQASILDLYDPDRSQKVRHNGSESSWNDFVAWMTGQVGAAKSSGGAGLAILCEATGSPSVRAMKQRLAAAMPRMTWHEYEPLNNDNALHGSQATFGQAYRPLYSFDKAKVVVALDSDFLGESGSSGGIKWSRDFAKSRRVNTSKEPGFANQRMSRLYSFEGVLSLTGANADHRIAVRSADVGLIAARIAAAVVDNASQAVGELTNAAIDSTHDAAVVNDAIAHAIEDLKHARGQSIVIAGPRQPAEVHYLAHLINESLGNLGQTVSYARTPDDAPHLASIQALAQNISAGGVQTLVILGGNPVYDAPAELNFAELLKKVSRVVHLSHYINETSLAGGQDFWHINRAHYLEAWGDGRAYDGTISIAQPLIEPLFGGKSIIELLAVLAGDQATSGYDIVRRAFAERGGPGDFETAWRKALHDGIVANTAYPVEEPQVQRQGLITQMQALAARRADVQPSGIEVVFAADASVHDGRYANNGWLQECPDPITKLTWDNAAVMNPATAERLGVDRGDMITISSGGRDVTAAVMPLPGQHVNTVTLALGYGRTIQGFEGDAKIATGAGFNFYGLRNSGAMNFAAATLTRADGHYTLATTQDHHPIGSVGQSAPGGVQDRLPTLFREGTVGEYLEHPDFAKHRTHVVHRLSLWEEDMPFHSATGRKNADYAWAMSIDLNSCTGCNACVIACQAENNVPIVGKEQVRKNREMHWLRVDRYFKGGTETMPAGFVVSPVFCVHCENAPCEQVCPVAATTHDTDGLNVMVYNRCVGTRYCSNNCPYKVRRFNYFDFHRREPYREEPGVLLHVEPEYYRKGQAKADPLRQLQFNPEVTVRSRGIMEKCTYCVQRISKAKIEAKDAWVKAKNLNPNDPAVQDTRVPIADGVITTACAQACPSQAIVFGDLNDPNSRVAKLHKHERAYEMLEELNTKPRTKYMAKLTNPAFGGSTHAGH